jgi:hypothetical protein
MPNWLDKTEEEIIKRLKNVLRTDDFQFIGKYEPVPQKDFGFFKDVRSLSGVRKFYPKDDGTTDERKIRPLEIYTKAYDKLVADKWYKFHAVPAANPLRINKRNPFLLQTDWKRVRDILLLEGKELIENIKNDALNTPEGIAGNLMRAIETISIDINTEPTTFIFELIQNADDYPNSDNNVSITFQIDDSHLIIKHNGSEFEVNNTVALCGVNEGDKRADSNKIGFKGIGFKSIFKDANFAYVKSGDFSFRFDEEFWRKQGIEIFWHITPIHTPSNEFKQVLKTESNVNIVIKPNALQALKTYKETFVTHFNNERILLFLRNVKSLTFDSPEEKFEISNTSSKWKILTESNVEIPEEETNELNRRINFPDRRIPVKFYDITITELGFGFRINKNKVESIGDGFIYAYLPTKVNLGFSFILNGNFIPDAPRTKIHSDLKWNSFLFERAGVLFIKQIKALLTLGLDKASVLNQIPSFSEILLNITDDDKIIFINCFKRGFEKEILDQHFIPTQSGPLETLSNILIDETGLADFLKEEFFELTGIRAKLIDNEVGEGIEKIKALISEYGQGVVYDIEDLKASLKTVGFQDWLKNPSNNFRLIQHFHSTAALQSLLETEEIILSESKQLLKSSALFSGVPNEITFLTIEKISSELVGLLTDSKINVSLTEFEPVKFFKKYILANQIIINASLTNETNLLNFWKFIFDNWTLFESDIAIKDSFKHFEVLCKPKIENELSKKVISSAYLSSEFNSTSDIEIVVKDISPDEVFVSDKYIDKKREAEKWRKIFKQASAITDLQKVIEVLLPQLPIIEPAKHFEIAKQIFKFWKDPANKLTEAQIVLIKTNLNIKCVDKKFRRSTDCIISDHYNNNQLIASWLPNIELANQVAQEYAPRTNQVTAWKNFFALIGCIELTDKQNVFDAKIDFIITAQYELREKHFELLKNISDLHKNKKENGLSFEFEKGLSHIKLRTSNDEWHLPNQIHLSNLYKPKLSLQNDDAINSTLHFINEKYVPTEIQKYFLTNIGVNDGFYFKKIIPTIQIDKVQEHKFVSQLESIEKYRLRVQEIKKITKKNATGYSVRSYPDEKIRLNTYLANHLLINYPQLLLVPKYSELFLKFVIKDKNIDTLSIETEIKIWNNNVYKHPNYIAWLLQTHSELENQVDEFVKPPQLFSFNLDNYISNKAELPKINYSTQIAENGKSLEEVLGIQQMLTISHCIELLCRIENKISYEEIIQLQIVEILSGYSPTDDEKSKLFLLNKNLEWKAINELFISTDDQFQIEPTQNLHEDFYPIAGSFGIQELSEENLVLKTSPKTPSVADEIESFFRSKAKFIAFKIDHLNYEEVEAMIIEKINQIVFYEVTSISKVFPEVKPIYKIEIAFHFELDENKTFYRDNWKTNSELKVYLHKHILEEKIPEAWFENVVNRWDEKELIELLIGEYGSTPFVTVGEIIDNEKILWDEYSEDEATYIKSIVNINYNQEGQLDANTTAKIKTLMLIKGDYGNSQISDEGRYLKAGNNEILVRSAQKGLLYLDLFHWERLTEDNVKIAVYTNSQINIFNSQEDLFQYCKPQNKFGVLRMPDDYNLDDYNSLDNIFDKGKWHFVFIVNENAKAAKLYKEIIDLDEYNNYG